MVLSLLRWVSLSHLRHAGLRNALSFLGIVLGVAVFGAIRIASESSQRAFQHSAQLVGGTDRLVISSAGGGVPEQLFVTLRGVEGVRTVFPVTTRYAPLFMRTAEGETDLGTVKLIGTDLLADSGVNPATGSASGQQPEHDDRSDGKVILRLLQPGAQMLASGDLLSLLTGAVGDSRSVELGIGTERVPVTIHGPVRDGLSADGTGERMLVTDIANLQDLFGEYGTVDQLIVLIDKADGRAEVRERVQQLIAPPVLIEEDGAEARHSEKITAAFRLNLNFLAAISLLVSFLLIYNSVSYEVLRRRREMGILQCLGAGRGALSLAMVAETAVAGFLGAVCGTVCAYFLSSGAVTAVTRSISTLYVPITMREVELPLWLIIECLLVGTLISILGAALPSLEIRSIPPRERLGYQSFEQRFERRIGMLASVGLLLLGAAFLCTYDSVLRSGIYAGFLTPTLFLIGTGLMVPLLLVSVLTLSRSIGTRALSVSLLLAADHIRMTLRRNSVAAAAVIVSLGLYAGVTTMITSFRESVEGWIHHVTKADLYVSPGYSAIGSRGGMTLPEELVTYLCAHPLVEACDWVLAARVRMDERDVRITGTRLEILREHERLLFMYPMTNAELDRIIADDSAAIVSESFAHKSRVERGDTIIVPTPAGLRSFTIANIYYDYSSDQGVVMIADRIFENAFGSSSKSGVSLYLRPSAGQNRPGIEPPQSIESDLRARFPRVALTIRSNSALRQEVLRVFDETFAITYALQGIAVLIAFLTLAHAVTMLTLERKRELGVMRAIGASRRALIQMVASESLLLGVTSLIGAVVVGGGLSLILVEVVNRFFFGWSIGFTFAYAQYWTLTVAVLVVAFAAGAIPGWHATRNEAGRSVRYE